MEKLEWKQVLTQNLPAMTHDSAIVLLYSASLERDERKG